MTKPPTISARECIKAFGKIGFKVDRKSGSHTILRNDRGQILSIPDHKGKPVSKGVLRDSIKDAGITVEEFIELLKR